MGFDPFTPPAIEDPYPQYARLRATDPVHWSDKLRSWVLFRYDDVAAAFREDARLSSERSPSGIPIRTVASDPPAHGPVRAMLTASLGPRVRTVGAYVQELIATLLDALGPATTRAVERAELDGEVDLIAGFAYPLPIQVIAQLFDVPPPERTIFEEHSRAIARGMDRFFSSGEVMEGLRRIGAYFLEMVQERRATTGDDLVHRLLAAEHHGDRLSELEVVSMCSALVFGGHETTVNLIGNGMLALLRHPEELERLRHEPAMIDTAVEDLLRFDGPAQLLARRATTDLELGGKRIAAGHGVLIAPGAANRDPARFAEPDRLDVGREPNPHLAFGLGTHFCPGAQLSRIEARAAIPALLARFPQLRLGPTSPVWRKTAVLRGLERLPVRLG
jgi:cytochrome P450